MEHSQFLETDSSLASEASPEISRPLWETDISLWCSHADHHLVVARVRKRRAVSKQTTHRVHMESSISRNLTRYRLTYRIEIPNRFEALEHLDTEVYINRGLGNY
jgi:hypothetical protein